MVHVVRNVRIDVEVSAQPFINHSWQLAAPQNAAKCGPPPDASRHKLEWAGRYLLPRAGNADDGALVMTTVGVVWSHKCVPNRVGGNVLVK